jgi:hypothetical protein
MKKKFMEKIGGHWFPIASPLGANGTQWGEVWGNQDMLHTEKNL